MTFLASWRLAFLAVPVLLLVAYLLAQRSRRRAAVRFTGVDLLASVAPRRPGWQRHVPAGALLLAFVVFVLAFAEPARVIRTPKQRATVMLTLDVSGSMAATDVAPPAWPRPRRRPGEFVDALPRGVQLGLVAFSTNASVLVAPTTDRATVDTPSTASKPAAAPPRPRRSTCRSRPSRPSPSPRGARRHPAPSSS